MPRKWKREAKIIGYNWVKIAVVSVKNIYMKQGSHETRKARLAYSHCLRIHFYKEFEYESAKK